MNSCRQVSLHGAVLEWVTFDLEVWFLFGRGGRSTTSVMVLFPQINDLNQVPVPVMLLPDDFKANSKIKVNNHLFNK